MVSFAAIVPYTFSLFLSPLQLAFGWKRQAISLGFALAALTVAACSPVIGSLLDRLPPRQIILPSTVIFGCGTASLSLLSEHIWQFYAIYVVLGIVGNGTAQLPYDMMTLPQRGLCCQTLVGLHNPYLQSTKKHTTCCKYPADTEGWVAPMPEAFYSLGWSRIVLEAVCP